MFVESILLLPPIIPITPQASWCMIASLPVPLQGGEIDWSVSCSLVTIWLKSGDTRLLLISKVFPVLERVHVCSI